MSVEVVDMVHIFNNFRDQRDFLDQLEGMDYLGDQAFLDHLDQLVNQERMEIREKLVYPVKKYGFKNDCVRYGITFVHDFILFRVLKAIKGPWVRLDQ